MFIITSYISLLHSEEALCHFRRFIGKHTLMLLYGRHRAKWLKIIRQRFCIVCVIYDLERAQWKCVVLIWYIVDVNILWSIVSGLSIQNIWLVKSIVWFKSFTRHCWTSTCIWLSLIMGVNLSEALWMLYCPVSHFMLCHCIFRLQTRL